MNPLRIGLGTVVVVVVSVFLVLNKAADNHPILRVSNVAGTSVMLYAEVGGQVRDLGELPAGESRGFRVRSDVQRVFGARFPTGEAVVTGLLYLAPGQQLEYAVDRDGWRPTEIPEAAADLAP